MFSCNSLFIKSKRCFKYTLYRKYVLYLVYIFCKSCSFLHSWTKGDKYARVTPCPSLYLLTLVWVEFWYVVKCFSFSSFRSLIIWTGITEISGRGMSIPFCQHVQASPGAHHSLLPNRYWRFFSEGKCLQGAHYC